MGLGARGPHRKALNNPFEPFPSVKVQAGPKMFS